MYGIKKSGVAALDSSPYFDKYSMKGSVAMLNLRIEDRNPHLKDELHAIMEENKDVFQSVLSGRR